VAQDSGYSDPFDPTKNYDPAHDWAIDDHEHFEVAAESPATVSLDQDSRPLRLVRNDDDDVYRADREAHAAWKRIGRITADGNFRDAPASARLLAMLEAWWSPLRFGDQVYVTRRTTADGSSPTGGIVTKIESGTLHARSAARFGRMCEGREVPSTGAITDATRALAGQAMPLAAEPFLRWGRGPDGALRWDSGDEAGTSVRLNADGWSIEDSPGAFFRRPTRPRPVQLPVHGGSIDELWNFVRIDPAHRPLVVAWMLSAMVPDESAATPVLYLSGPQGAAKSTTATIIAQASGDQPPRQAPKDPSRIKDFLVALAGGWIAILDNLSFLSNEQSDTLCTVVTGVTESNRKLHTDSDVVELSIRRPLIATAIDIGIIRPDLAERMIPIRLPDPPSGMTRRSETTIMADFEQARPRIFGALLDLAVQVLGAPTPDVPLPRLADFGIIAAKVDAITGSNSLDTLDTLLASITASAVLDDPFWQTMYAVVGREWTGTASQLLEACDPLGNLAREHGREWPNGAKSVTHRLERTAPSLRSVGWTVKRIDADASQKRSVRWHLIPPDTTSETYQKNAPHPRGCRCDECTTFHF
jgi:hypothetical protein